MKSPQKEGEKEKNGKDGFFILSLTKGEKKEITNLKTRRKKEKGKVHEQGAKSQPLSKHYGEKGRERKRSTYSSRP